MKTLFSFFLLNLSIFVSATDYFVKNGGNDQYDGTSDATAWATVERVNSAFTSLKPGDRILFKRGGTFYGSIKVKSSVASGSPITIGAYGTGDNPVITGFTVISSWTNEGNGIYSAPLVSEELTNMVVIAGRQFAMGRWPDSVYNIFESASSNVSITDNELSTTINWEGAEVAIRKNDWSIDRCIITDHSGTRISYSSLSSSQDAIAGHGYFIQNDIRTLSRFGEWFHDKSFGKFYLMLGNTSLENLKIEVATLNNIICINDHDYITIENLSLRGSIQHLITSNGYFNNNYINIKNSQLAYAGIDGIQIWGRSGSITGNIISGCNQAGISVVGDYHDIRENKIADIGIHPGQAFKGDASSGIIIGNDNCTIERNIIRRVGYCGLYLSSTADIITITNNVIDSVLLTLNDGGGIYTAREGTRRIIDGNIIMNVIGNASGTPYPDRPIARGIYLDVGSSNVIATNNTAFNCSESGFMIHRASGNTFENNTSFNNKNGFFFQNSLGSTISNNILKGNIFFAKGSSHYSLKFTSTADDIPSFGTADNNYYARPIDDNDVIFTYSPSTGYNYRTLSNWQSFTNQDRNSKKSAVTVSDTSKIDFYYNPTSTNRIITINQPMVDVTGKKYTGSVTLLPYTSVILMPDPNPSTPVIPVFTGATIENSAPSTIVLNYSITLASITPAPSAFIVKVNGETRTVTTVTISGTKASLVLANGVKYGDVVTLSYVKPAGSFLQTAEGTQAASFSNQAVVNNCTAPSQLPVQPNQPPVISIASPVNGSSYDSPATVEIEVTAHDPDGPIQSVIIYNGNEKLGERAIAPYIFTLKDLPEGSYSIYAVATDNLKSTTASASLEFHVTSPEINKGSLSLYPNPNNGQFSIDYIAPDGLENFTLTIFNPQGRSVMVEEVSQGQYSKQYDLSHLLPGIYIVMISAERILTTHKFIKK